MDDFYKKDYFDIFFFLGEKKKKLRRKTQKNLENAKRRVKKK